MSSQGSVTYAEAVDGALDRLRSTGLFIEHFFANHGPMAAEALATLGYCGEVDDWLDTNMARRNYEPLPRPSRPIDSRVPDDWRAALGDLRRSGDWVEMFRRELAEASWREVLQTWWQRLLPGCSGSLVHGLIRSAHAVRSLGDFAQPSDLRIDELARGLALWATSFRPLRTEPPERSDLDASAVDAALSKLTAEYCGHYTATMPSFPIPLIHTITGPAAMRLLLAQLPAELHAPAFYTIEAVNEELFAAFGGKRFIPTSETVSTDSTSGFAALAAEAVDIGDEHAIKICEAAMRENAVQPDPRYLSAATSALTLIRNR